MEISVSTGLYYTKNYKDILDAIARTSCKNIELMFNQGIIDVPLEDLKREISIRNLKVLTIHTPLEFIAFSRRESEEFWINKAIEMANVFGAKVIVTHMVMGEYFKELPFSLDELHKENILKYKNINNICITTENLPYITDGSFLGKEEKFIDFIYNNDVNITFDTTHCAASKLDIIRTFNKIKDKVKNIHLSDFKNGAEHKILGTGELQLKEFLENLKKEEYKGIITIELDFDNKKRNMVDTLEQASEEIEKSIELVRNIVFED